MDYILNRISKEIDIFYAIGDTVFFKNRFRPIRETYNRICNKTRQYNV